MVVEEILLFFKVRKAFFRFSGLVSERTEEDAALSRSMISPAFANRVFLIDAFTVDFSEKTSQKVGPLLRIVL